MNWKSVIMPVVVMGLLALTLPFAGVHGSAVAACAAALAVLAWVVGRLTFHIAGYFTRTDSTFLGLVVTLLTTVGLGFLGSLFTLGALTDLLGSQIAWTAGAAPALVSLGVGLGSIVIRIIVNAVLPDRAKEQAGTTSK